MISGNLLTKVRLLWYDLVKLKFHLKFKSLYASSEAFLEDNLIW